MQGVGRAGPLVHQDALGDLELELRGRQARVVERARDLAEPAGAAELVRRDVDRHPQRAAEDPLDRRDVATRLAQDPAAELDDHAAVLGDRDEAVGWDLAELRVRPPGQRLDADDPAGADVDLGLVGDGQPAVAQGLAQRRRQRQGVVAELEHVVGEPLEVVAPGRLGVLHREVGALEQLGRVRPAGRMDGAADAHRDGQRVAADRHRRQQVLEQHVHPRGHRFRPLEAGQHDRELVAAEPGDDVGAADPAPEPVGDPRRAARRPPGRPSASLTRLRWSRSTTRTATSVPSCSAAAIASPS